MTLGKSYFIAIVVDGIMFAKQYANEDVATRVCGTMKLDDRVTGIKLYTIDDDGEESDLMIRGGYTVTVS